MTLRFIRIPHGRAKCTGSFSGENGGRVQHPRQPPMCSLPYRADATRRAYSLYTESGEETALFSGWVRSIAQCLIAVSLLSGVLAGCSGCGSLPRFVPDMSTRPAAPVRLEDGRGPLTAQQSKAILSRLESRGEATSIFDRHLALEESIAGSPLMVGNKVVLLQDGPVAFQHMFDAIHNATAPSIWKPTSSKTMRSASASRTS